MTRGDDWSGYGPGWERLRSKTLNRDDYMCQRCGNTGSDLDDVPLQAHHIIPRSEGGSDSLTNLITLCRRCHGVQHPENEAFDDDRPDAPLFPHPQAHEDVAKMRTPDDADCDRCGFTYNPDYLAGINSTDSDLTVCKPCAGVVCDSRADVSVGELFGTTSPTTSETVGAKTKTHPVPYPMGSSFVREVRTPESRTERLFSSPVSRIFRLFGTAILFVLIFASVRFYLQPETPREAATVLFSACIGSPIIKWGIGGICYKISSIADPTHEDHLYTPSIRKIRQRVKDSLLFMIKFVLGLMFLAFAFSVTYVVISSIVELVL